MKILVPVDGSAPSGRAVEHALRLVGGSAQGEILLLNVQGEVSDISGVISVESRRAEAERRGKELLRGAVGLCEKAGVRFATAIEIGPVARTVDHVARAWHADQIVMGTRGLGPLGRLLLGSVATRVAELAAVPVTLVK